MRNRLYIICAALGLLLAPTACEDYLDVNKNVDAPNHVDAYLYLAGVQQAYVALHSDVRATGPLTQMMGTTAIHFTNYAEHYIVPTTRDEGTDVWRLAYFLQGMNLENLIRQSEEAEEWTLAGIGYAMKAFSWDQLTKMHADLPLTDAFVPNLLSHDYNYQSEIYPKVREWAYKSIEYLEREDATTYGTKITANDYIYGGDKAKWIKFAYGVIVRNLASLSNKTDFTTAYAQELIAAAGKSFVTSADDATLRVAGGSAAAPFAAFNNDWGTLRNILTYNYFQHEYAVQVFTGTVPRYDEATGNKISVAGNPYYPYELANKQIIADTAVITQVGHYDPRVAVKLASLDDPTYNGIDNFHAVKKRRYYGGTFAGKVGPIGTAPSFYGRTVASTTTGATHDGAGRWLYRDNAPYILMTCAELKFCLAETYWKLGNTTDAFEAFKAGVKEDIAFTAKYIAPGTKGSATGGDKITVAVFNTLATQYTAGPYVDALPAVDFSLSHIMMQKWVALYPWGAQEAWVDMRKYHYDISYTGEYPSPENGAWTAGAVNQKWDTDPSKVYKGLYLAPAQVQGRKITYHILNEGAPSYRIRPRYNSEYMWNRGSLETLVPVSGLADNYQTSIPWFAYPNDLPVTN
jgi:hypothetical protein